MQRHSHAQKATAFDSPTLTTALELFYPRLAHYLDETYGFKADQIRGGPSRISFTGTAVGIDSSSPIEDRVHLTMMFFGLAVVLANISDEQSRAARVKDYFSLGIPRYEEVGMRYAAQVFTELNRGDLIAWLSERAEGDRVFTDNALSETPAISAEALQALRSKRVIPAPSISPEDIPRQPLRTIEEENIY